MNLETDAAVKTQVARSRTSPRAQQGPRSGLRAGTASPTGEEVGSERVDARLWSGADGLASELTADLKGRYRFRRLGSEGEREKARAGGRAGRHDRVLKRRSDR